MILLYEISFEILLNKFLIILYLIILLSCIKYTPKINGPKNVIIFDIYLLNFICVINKEIDIDCNIIGNEDFFIIKSQLNIIDNIFLNPFCSFIIIFLQ